LIKKGKKSELKLTVDGNYLVVGKDLVFEVYRGKDEEDNKVIIKKKASGKKEQIWKLEYTDEVVMNRRFGLLEN
jgi:hypothetical protein